MGERGGRSGRQREDKAEGRTKQTKVKKNRNQNRNQKRTKIKNETTQE